MPVQVVFTSPNAGCDLVNNRLFFLTFVQRLDQCVVWCSLLLCGGPRTIKCLLGPPLYLRRNLAAPCQGKICPCCARSVENLSGRLENKTVKLACNAARVRRPPLRRCFTLYFIHMGQRKSSLRNVAFSLEIIQIFDYWRALCLSCCKA